MGSRDILALLSPRVLEVTRARPGSTFCQVQRLMLHVVLGLGKDPAEMRPVTQAKDQRVMLLVGTGVGSRRSPSAPARDMIQQCVCFYVCASDVHAYRAYYSRRGFELIPNMSPY